MATTSSLHFQYSACSRAQVGDRSSNVQERITRSLQRLTTPFRSFDSCSLKCSSHKKKQAHPHRISLPKCCVGNSTSVLEENRTISKEDESADLNRRAKEVLSGLKGTSIFLIGMMGSGKTTVGKVLANSLGYYFFDSDSVVEQAAGGASVAKIFSENGEEAFRDAESAVLGQLSSMGRLVVATGGGSVIRPANWGRMRNGVIVWLDVPVEALAKRVSDIGTASRPILCKGTKYQDDFNEAYKRLSAIFEERQKYYVPADARVSLQAIASEDGVEVCQISPSRIALQVLNEVDVLIQRRKMQDESRAFHS